MKDRRAVCEALLLNAWEEDRSKKRQEVESSFMLPEARRIGCCLVVFRARGCKDCAASISTVAASSSPKILFSSSDDVRASLGLYLHTLCILLIHALVTKKIYVSLKFVFSIDIDLLRRKNIIRYIIEMYTT